MAKRAHELPVPDEDVALEELSLGVRVLLLEDAGVGGGAGLGVLGGTHVLPAAAAATGATTSKMLRFRLLACWGSPGA